MRSAKTQCEPPHSFRILAANRFVKFPTGNPQLRLAGKIRRPRGAPVMKSLAEVAPQKV